ncbi:MAG: hypothetical protein K0R38_114 [Polyangiaceae bacterium]|jgi:hypothetical protein|nr:hypothetical protein [Polyangiaceae bacterium]
MRKRSRLVALLAVLVASLVGCSEDEGSTVGRSPRASAGMQSTSGGSAPAGGAAGRGAAAGAPSSGNAGGAGGTASGEACPGLPIATAGVSGGGGEGGAPLESDADACNGVSVEAEAVPVDLFVIMDRSQSMAEAVHGGSMTRWEALRGAVQSFSESPGAAGIRAGIGFFSRSGGGDDAKDCDPDAYAAPSVPIGLVSDIGPDMVAAMDDVSPGGFTPTVPALQGAISYARGWAQDSPGRATLVVLVTDGFPTQCVNDPDQISQAARAGYESAEHIRTFVIGVGDVAKLNLDNYARAGGTKKAYLTDQGDVTRTFVDALNNITSRALACDYQLPPAPDGMKLDRERVQVVYTPSSGGAEEIPSISSLGACAKNQNGGWYYDDATNPSKITVCPCTCARFQAGRVDVRLGCKPRLGLR